MKLPFLWTSLAFILGILLAKFLPFSDVFWKIFTLIAFFGAGLSWGLGKKIKDQALSLHLIMKILLLGMMIGLGGWRYSAFLPDISPQHVAWYNDDDYAYNVRGIIVDFPDQRDQYVLANVQVDSLYRFEDGQSIVVEGLILVRLPLGEDWWYGDPISLSGQLLEPPENELFSYSDYLARHGVYSYMPYNRAELIAAGQGNPIIAGYHRE